MGTLFTIIPHLNMSWLPTSSTHLSLDGKYDVKFSDHQEVRRAGQVWQCSLRCSSLPAWTRGSSSSSWKASSKLSFLNRSESCMESSKPNILSHESKQIYVSKHIQCDPPQDFTSVFQKLHSRSSRIRNDLKNSHRTSIDLRRHWHTQRSQNERERRIVKTDQHVQATRSRNQRCKHTHYPKMAFTTVLRWKHVMKVQNLLFLVTLQSMSLAYINHSDTISMYLFSKLWYQGCPKIGSDY